MGAFPAIKLGQLQISAVDSTAVFFRKKKGGRVQMPRSASAECSRAVGRRAARRTAPARARSAPDGAKTRGDNEQGGAHRHLHLAHRQTSTLLPRARRSMTASWARPRRPRRGRPAAHCRFGRSTAHKSAPEGVWEQWAAGRGAAAARRAANAVRHLYIYISILPWRRLG